MTEKERAIVIDEKPNVHAGLSLKQAREAKKLSPSDVASELRLTRGAIESLENQQWDNLHGRAYARGYFLNYVRFLGLNEAQMMAAFDDEYSIDDNQQKLSRPIPETKSIPWLGIIFVLAALVITWFAYQQWQSTSSPESIPELIEDQPDDFAPTQQFDSFESSVVEPIEPQEVEPEPVSSLAESLTELTAPEAAEDVATQIESEPVLEQAEQTNTVIDEMSVAELSPAPENQAKLIFSAVKDCWVEVTDAQQNVLYYNLVKADDTVTVVGEAPVKVLLGNASDINVTVNGNQFDTSSFVHGDVARFTVGVES